MEILAETILIAAEPRAIRIRGAGEARRTLSASSRGALAGAVRSDRSTLCREDTRREAYHFMVGTGAGCCLRSVLGYASE